MKQRIAKAFAFLKTEKYKKMYPYLGICVLFICVLLLIVRVNIYHEILPYVTYLENNDEEQFIRNLTSGRSIEQTFISPHDFECLTLSCSHHDMIIEGKTIVEIWDEQTESLAAYEEIDNHSIYYGVPVEIHFDGVCKQDRTYRIKITALDTEEDALGFYGYIPQGDGDTALLDGSASEYALSLGTHTHTRLFNGLLWIVMVVMLAGLGILSWFLIRKELRPEQLFLVITIPMGIALLCFMSVNFINDGDAHFARTYYYANKILDAGDTDNGGAIAMRSDDVDTLFASSCKDAPNAQNMWHIYENWKWFADDKSIVEGIEWKNAGSTNMIMYLPSVVAVVLARLLGLGTYPMIYLAKIVPFICYLAGIYCAIKAIPVGKHILLFLAALPIAVQQAVGITYDNVTLIALFLMISYTLKIYYEGINIKDGIVLTASCMLIASCKGGIYTPMLFLLLFLPKEKMGGIKGKLKYVFGTGILTLCTMLAIYGATIWRYIQPSSETSASKFVQEVSEESSEDGDVQMSTGPSNYGISYVVKNPKGFIRLVVNTSTERIEYYVNTMLGRNLAWSVQELPLWAYGLFGIILLCAKNGIGEERYHISLCLRVGMTVTFFLVVMAYFLLFLIETPVSYSYIWGLQGRYFLPQMLLLLLALRNDSVTQRSGTENMLYLGYYMQMSLFVAGYFLMFMTQTYRY